MPKLEFWFEFASTYSYLSAMAVEDLGRTTGVTIEWRPFLLGPIFQAQGWKTSPFNLYPAKGKNMWRDMERLCQEADLPLMVPAAFPANSLYAARSALVGLEEGWGEAFCKAVYRAEFQKGLDIATPSVLSACVEEAGGNASSALNLIQKPDVKDQLRQQTEAAIERGIYGAPSFITEDQELFWGHDRMEQAVSWARKQA